MKSFLVLERLLDPPSMNEDRLRLRRSALVYRVIVLIPSAPSSPITGVLADIIPLLVD